MTRALAAVLLMCAAGVAFAQLRTVPTDARRATIWYLQDRLVQIDDRRVLLSPGARIRDIHNRLVLPAAIPPGSTVSYQLDAQGMLHQVWILTPQEAAQPAPSR